MRAGENEGQQVSAAVARNSAVQQPPHVEIPTDGADDDRQTRRRPTSDRLGRETHVQNGTDTVLRTVLLPRDGRS